MSLSLWDQMQTGNDTSRIPSRYVTFHHPEPVTNHTISDMVKHRKNHPKDTDLEQKLKIKSTAPEICNYAIAYSYSPLVIPGGN